MTEKPTQASRYLDFQPGCRPCCSRPYGKSIAIFVPVVGTIALLLSWVSGRTCHFLTADFTFCTPPPAPASVVAYCGDCHCINGDNPCPDGGDQIPQTDFSADVVNQFKSLQVTNPYTLSCNPYNDTECDTTPPQILTELGDDAVCGIKYSTTTLDEMSCPIEYGLMSYQSETAANADGAFPTHWGACGVCSTAHDLAVYIEFPDLTTKGTECTIRTLSDFQDGIDCYTEVGYTEPCARIWAYNGINTREECFGVCAKFTLSGAPNNSPAPTCRIADCLQCDEDMSGPAFQKVGARSRRRSGLLSKIARLCDAILLVDHVLT
jgi:hypothetical protein